MNFVEQFEEQPMFTDLFNYRQHEDQFDDISNGSGFNDIIDAIIKDNSLKIDSDVKDDTIIEPTESKEDELSFHNLMDNSYLFEYPSAEQQKETILMRENSKATNESAEAELKEKIFKISFHNKIQVSSSKNDTNEKPEIKIISDEDDDVQTELDQLEYEEILNQAALVKKPRRDVTYKTILRKCRKYYQTLFNEVTGYLKGKKKEPCSFYRSCVLNFIESNFEYKTHLDVSFHLG
jgi:hypothetical protein